VNRPFWDFSGKRGPEPERVPLAKCDFCGEPLRLEMLPDSIVVVCGTCFMVDGQERVIDDV